MKINRHELSLNVGPKFLSEKNREQELEKKIAELEEEPELAR